MIDDILNRKPTTTTDSPKTVGTSATPPVETIAVPKSEWDAMKETVRLLEEGGSRKIPKVKDRVAKITLYEGKIVTKVVRTWMERKFGEVNKNDTDKLFALIETEDKKQYTVDFLALLNNADRIICAIKKVEKTDVSVNHGEFNTQNIDPRENKNFQSEEAQDLETKTDDDYTLEILTGERKGEVLTLNHLALNL